METSGKDENIHMSRRGIRKELLELCEHGLTIHEHKKQNISERVSWKELFCFAGKIKGEKNKWINKQSTRLKGK